MLNAALFYFPESFHEDDTSNDTNTENVTDPAINILTGRRHWDSFMKCLDTQI